jgi:phosphotransferase system  glucose/maltose/N-acetylglucosamine-specific IIC component
MKFLLGYLDPNSGSVILQAILGVFLAAGYFFRHTVVGFFRRSKKTEVAKKAETKTSADSEEAVE